MWALRAAGLLCLLLAAGLGPCPPPALLPDTVLSPVGGNVTLHCPPGRPEPSGAVSWRLESQAGSREHVRPAGPGGSLLLLRVQLNDSGRYSCYADGCLVQSLRLLVEEPPEPPSFSCARRSPAKDVLCEWQPQRRPSPRTRAVLWVKKWLSGDNATEQQCRYFPKAEKFTCRLRVPPSEDDTLLLVSVSVRNGAGSATSKDQVISANRVLKPDPPGSVRAEPVERAPQKLRVAWTYPPSWDPRFYRLHFQVRYRAERSHSYTEVDQLRDVSLVLHDAWQGARHRVQVRALEEFGHGSWSEWSQEAVGTPWADPSDVQLQTDAYGSQFPSDYEFYGETFTAPLGCPGSSTEGETGPADGDGSAVPLSTFLVTGGSLLLGIALLAGILVRYRKKWRRGPLGQGKASGVHHALVPLAPPSPTSPLSEAPLLSPPASPGSSGCPGSPGSQDFGPFDVTNMDYLLVPQ